MNDRQTTLDFLYHLHKNSSGGSLVFHAFKGQLADTFRTGSPKDFVSWINKREKGGWGIHMRQGRMSPLATRQTKSDVQSISHLWLDIDDPSNNALGECGKFEPTYEVKSGKGLHVYWRLDTPVVDRSNFATVERVLKKMAKHWQGDPSPTHIASSLRLVETLNHKYDPPIMAKILRHNVHNEINIGELEQWLDANIDPVLELADRLCGSTNGLERTDWQAVIDNLKIEGSENIFGGRNNCVTKLAGFWARQNVPPEDQLHTLKSYGCTLPLREMTSIVKRIWDKEKLEVLYA